VAAGYQNDAGVQRMQAQYACVFRREWMDHPSQHGYNKVNVIDISKSFPWGDGFVVG
jgi:hypothetical protein